MIKMNYGSDYEREFLNDVICQIINEHCKDFDFSGFAEVIVYPIGYLSNNSSGRMEDNKLLLSYHLLKDISFVCDVYNPNAKIYLDQILSHCVSNEAVKCLYSTIYHELCHMTRRKKMPDIYDAVMKYWDDDVYLAFAAQYWVEYDAHLLSNKLENLNLARKYCESFVKFDWRTNENGYWYLLKCLAYFTSRLNLLNINNIYIDLSKIRDKEILELVYLTINESDILINHELVDEIHLLQELRNLFESCHKNIYL